MRGRIMVIEVGGVGAEWECEGGSCETVRSLMVALARL